MYFPNAFKKVFMARAVGGDIDLRTTGSTADLPAGAVGLYDSDTYQAISAAPGSGNQPFILAQGSYHTNDKMGPFHGGYQESVKSKKINPKYISRAFTIASATPQTQIIAVGWDLNTSGGNETGPVFECGKTYRLRLDYKGSPVLRFLNHNGYKDLDAYTGCCGDDCNAGCTGDPKDPVTVLLQWKDIISQDPFLSKFLQAEVYWRDGAGPYTAEEAYSAYDVSQDSSLTAYVEDTTDPEDIIAGIKIMAAYEDTKFGDCTFTVTDHYELEPIFVFASLRDESGNPCAIRNVINSATEEMVTELQAPRQAQGVGETVLREWILSNRYLQDTFPDGSHIDQFRLREVLDDVALPNTTRTGLYDRICILHNVPRFNNPTGVFDNDQYLCVVIVPAGTDTTAFTTLLQDFLDLAGNGVTIESL